MKLQEILNNLADSQPYGVFGRHESQNQTYYNLIEKILSMYVDEYDNPILEKEFNNHETTNIKKNITSMKALLRTKYGFNWQKAESFFNKVDIKSLPDNEYLLKQEFFQIEEAIFADCTHVSKLKVIPAAYKKAVQDYIKSLDKAWGLNDEIKAQKKDVLQDALKAKDIEAFKNALLKKDNGVLILAKPGDSRNFKAFVNKLPFEWLKSLVTMIFQKKLKVIEEKIEPMQNNFAKNIKN